MEEFFASDSKVEQHFSKKIDELFSLLQILKKILTDSSQEQIEMNQLSLFIEGMP
jgi:hypothetical protein